MAKNNFELQSEGAAAAEPALRAAIELANPGGLWIHDEYLVGDCHMMTHIPTFQVDADILTQWSKDK